MQKVDFKGAFQQIWPSYAKLNKIRARNDCMKNKNDLQGCIACPIWLNLKRQRDSSSVGFWDNIHREKTQRVASRATDCRFIWRPRPSRDAATPAGTNRARSAPTRRYTPLCTTFSNLQSVVLAKLPSDPPNHPLPLIVESHNWPFWQPLTCGQTSRNIRFSFHERPKKPVGWTGIKLEQG